MHGKPGSRRRELLGALALVAAVFAAYAGVAENGFVNFTDHDYIVENRPVAGGLSWEGVRWAFTSGELANWHPLTWLSHMLDVSLFGTADAAGHHLMSVALHALSAVLLFVVLRRMSGAFWCALAVAALFALHPLRVESVAWASERKDVLAGLFWMLALLAYHSWTQRGGIARYLLLAVLLVLGLMAKPMLVTLPCVLLLLDWWPLQRGIGAWAAIREKLPLFALVGASCVLTAIVQERAGAMDALAPVPLSLRVSNAASAYAAYVGLSLWPAGLAAIYPHPLARPTETYATWGVAPLAAAGLVVAITVGVVLLARRRRFPAVGWFWFLGTLVPVIGLVQVGAQAWADRYAYLPTIGLYLIVVWAVRELVQAVPRARHVAALAAVAALLALGLRTGAQVRVWRDSESLWRNALEVTSRNCVAHANLGSALAMSGRLDEALEHYRRAVEIDPGHSRALNGLGHCLAEKDQLEEALVHLLESRRLNPAYPEVHNNLGMVFALQERYAEARASLEQALRLHPHHLLALENLGGVLALMQSFEEAEQCFLEAFRLDPTRRQGPDSLIGMYRALGREAELTRFLERLRAISAQAY